MTTTINIPAAVRARAGKGAARAARRAGDVPAVIYGDQKPPAAIAIGEKLLRKELGKAGFFTKLIDLQIDGGAQRVLCKDVQWHPVSDRPIHADFLRVNNDTIVHVEIPVHFLNEAKSPGLKRGGVLSVVMHAIEVYCKASEIPEHFDIDLDGLDIHDSVHLSKVKIPPNVRPLLADRDPTVATIAPPTVVVETQSQAAGTAAEGEAAKPGEAAKAGEPAKAEDAKKGKE